MKLYGKNWTRREIEARVARIETIGGIRKFKLQDGPESGVEMIQVRTGAGLSYNLNVSRALDIGLAEFCGVPLSWHSVNGEIHPSYFDPSGNEWLRTAAGGLLMTCGLTQVGSPCEDNGEWLGIHGRIHHQPAQLLMADGSWEGDEYLINIKGVVEETKIFGEYLRLTRHIKSRLGENKIEIHDVVENIGFESAPHMILYHFNFGFPLISEHTKIFFPSKKVFARDKGTPIDGHEGYQAPEYGIPERVYYHELDTDKIENNFATVFIQNPHFPSLNNKIGEKISVRLSWNIETLPNLIQWRMHGAGTYALGIEPSNCDVKGRVYERDNGSLIFLEPGEKKHYQLEISLNQ